MPKTSIFQDTTTNDTATERPPNGIFTQILLSGLQGAGADAFGHVTAASLYNLADSMLSPWQQRPVFKSFVTQMSPLKTCQQEVTRQDLQQLVERKFKRAHQKSMQLTPSDVALDIEKQPIKAAYMRTLLKFYRAGLIHCDDHLSPFEAALQKKRFKLSPMGHFFSKLIQQNKI